MNDAELVGLVAEILRGWKGGKEVPTDLAQRLISLIAVATSGQKRPREIFPLPSDGEALISMVEMGAALGLSESTAWDRAAKDPNFPKVLRLGPKCTRVRVSEARAYIAGIEPSPPRTSPGLLPRKSKD